MPEQYAMIIGSGFEEFATGSELQTGETRFGSPSAALRSTDIAGTPVITLARHGEPHCIPPHAINYRANLAALKSAGATSVIALCTVGVVSAIRESGEIGLPDQVLDFTWGREHSIFDGSDGQLQHIDFTEPFSVGLRAQLLHVARSAAIDCYDGGVYATTQGPRLESAAEVDRLERVGADYVGMTAMPEAALARELGMEYACLALVVNRAAGRGDTPIHDDVEASTESARSLTESLLHAFFESIGA
ncbi:MAG: S-methyl-5'-thioinosine phosphorylase [Gammaproteobacteria bacterium]|nr:S-methyl-5'-thioinosine phosphorylase [Gammaproteobacteria bacterium]